MRTAGDIAGLVCSVVVLPAVLGSVAISTCDTEACSPLC
mgnify:FL=1